MENSVSVIIAAYNEQGNISRAVASVRRVLPSAEIVIADDGSTDQTLIEAQGAAADSLVRIIPLPHEGKGNAIRSAIDAAKGEIMVQIDADLQFPAEGIPGLIRLIQEQKADIVFGSRYLDPTGIEGGSIPFIKRLASLMVAWAVSGLCLRRFTDVFAGFKAWRAPVIRELDIREKGFSYEAEIAIKACRRDYKIAEVPTAYRRRLIGWSKIRLLKNICEVSWALMRVALTSR